jgi:hypothetical protein
MEMTFDYLAVQNFTTNLENQRGRADTDSRAAYQKLELRINGYTEMCFSMRAYINGWARSIFTGEVDFDPEAEAVLKEELERLVVGAKQVAALGRALGEPAVLSAGLAKLHYHIADLGYILENWVSPQLAVSPAPRVKLSAKVEQEIRERLKTLPPLPSDFCSTYPDKGENQGAK